MTFQNQLSPRANNLFIQDLPDFNSGNTLNKSALDITHNKSSLSIDQ